MTEGHPASTPAREPRRSAVRKWLRRVVLLALAAILAIVGLFSLNGLVLADDEAVLVGIAQSKAGSTAGSDGSEVAKPPARRDGELRVLAFNLAKLFVHNGGFDLANNHAQVRQLLAFSSGQPTLLAGDFNAEPADASMKTLQASERFSGAFQGQPTFSSRNPERRIDYILGPKAWKVLEHRVLANDVSDHSAVFTRFRVRP